MKKEDLLKSIAEAGYNVGFGAKKSFATYDMITKSPGVIGFISTSIGVLALFVDVLSAKLPSAFLIILGIAGLFIGSRDHKRDAYEKSGIELTKLFRELRDLYRHAKEAKDDEIEGLVKDLKEIEDRASCESISDQTFLSNWYAHYKFFWELQIDWINEQKRFRFFRDKIPLSLILSAIAFIVVVSGIVFLNQSAVSTNDAECKNCLIQFNVNIRPVLP